ncbi:hypothetical protein M0804_013281 [Polistes exclamans]|nr:hypothetical protein M0804_013281 [Polistes exclamans]
MSTTVPTELILRRYLRRFNARTMNVEKWLNQLDFMVELLEIPETRLVHFLFSMIDPSIRTKVFLNTAIANMFNITYETVSSMLQRMYTARPKRIGCYTRFHFRSQFYGESVEHFRDAITALIRKCPFGDRESMFLCARFVNGLRNKSVKKLCRRIKDISIETAFNIVKKIELRDRNRNINLSNNNN